MNLKFKLTPFPTVLRYTKLTTEAAETLGPYVKVDPAYSTHKGIHEHEYVHVSQWWIVTLFVVAVVVALPLDPLATMLGVIFSATTSPLLKSIPWVALAIEIKAYRVQFKITPEEEHIPTWAAAIKKHYKFRYTQEYIEKKLREGLL